MGIPPGEFVFPLRAQAELEAPKPEKPKDRVLPTARAIPFESELRPIIEGRADDDMLDNPRAPARANLPSS